MQSDEMRGWAVGVETRVTLSRGAPMLPGVFRLTDSWINSVLGTLPECERIPQKLLGHH
jgi:hypothetical protein